MSNITINQHYIPQCVLRNFCNDNGQVFECLVERKTIYPTNITKSMMSRNTYEHPLFETNKIEKWLSKIEYHYSIAINKIIKTIQDFEITNVGFDSIKHLINTYVSIFIIFYYRSGALLHEYEFEQRNKNDRILSMTDKLMNSKYIKNLTSTIIQNYNFAIIKSEQNNFLLSDQFISTAALSIKNKYFKVSNRHMGLKDVIILIPISKNYYAIYYDGDIPKYILQDRINILNEMQVSEINKVIINNSYVKCISYEKNSLVNSLIDFDYASPQEIIAGSDNGPYFGATLKKEIFFYFHDLKAWELINSYHYSWEKYNGIGRNDPCPCGSNKKYKKCCFEALKIADKILTPFRITQSYPFANVNMLKDAVSINATIELPIEEFSSK